MPQTSGQIDDNPRSKTSSKNTKTKKTPMNVSHNTKIPLIPQLTAPQGHPRNAMPVMPDEWETVNGHGPLGYGVNQDAPPVNAPQTPPKLQGDSLNSTPLQAHRPL